jgi:hypothetical protein
LKRATEDRDEATKRAEAAEAKAREAAAEAAGAAGARVEALDSENADLRAKLDEARATAATAAAEKTATLGELGESRAALEASQAEVAREKARAEAAEKARDAAATCADAADTCAAPLRLAAAQTRAERDALERHAAALGDRLSVARVAYAKAIETLQEVETRLIVPPLEMPAKSDEPALSALADDAGGATQAADEHADASDPEPEPPLAAPTVAAEEPAEGTERYVGMDVVFASEPPSEAPPGRRRPSPAVLGTPPELRPGSRDGTRDAAAGETRALDPRAGSRHAGGRGRPRRRARAGEGGRGDRPRRLDRRRRGR